MKSLNRIVQPVYMQMVEDLIEKINNGELKEGEHLISEKKLAKIYGISYMSVRKGLEELVKKGMIKKIAGKGNLILGSPSSIKKICVILHDTGSPFVQKLIKGMNEKILEDNVTLHYFDSSGEEELELSILSHLMEENFDGLIISFSSPYSCREKLTYFAEKGFPIVMLDSKVPGVNAPCITSDNVGGARLLVSHLIDQGYRRIAVIFPHSQISTVRARLEGYRQVLKERIGELYPELECLGKIKFGVDEEKENEEWVRTQVRKLIKMSKPPDAIFFEHDTFALYGLDELKKEGIKVPEEIGVVGFDDLPFASHISPSLTTVKQYCEKMGYKARKLLCEMLFSNEREKYSFLEIKLPVKLIVRESSKRKDIKWRVSKDRIDFG
ncbi:GntR family transcriptional regulator [Candidatus Calescamantes bacterium]|nr:GntR family transcriptional regulator [Candidatus Calescamantes bacterium]